MEKTNRELVGKVVSSVNNKTISSASELKNIIGSFSPNEVVTIKYIRDKKEYTAKVKLDRLENNETAQIDNTQNNNTTANKNYGLSVENITNQIRQANRLSNNFNGVIVSNVVENSKAYEVGFEKGDVIFQIEDMSINNVKDFNSAMKKYKKQAKRMLVYKRDGVRTIVLE